MPTEQIRPSLPKRNLDYLVLNEPNKVEIFRKFLNRKSGRELFKPYKGKIVRITESTYISDKGKLIRRNHLAVRLESTQLSFSGKQLTPVKKGQKRPIVPSSTSSSEDNRPLKQSGSRQRISAKTVYVPAHSKFPSMPVSHTPPRNQMVASKLREDGTSEAPGIQNIPYPQHSTPVVDLTVSSSTSGNQGTEAPISIKPKSISIKPKSTVIVSSSKSGNLGTEIPVSIKTKSPTPIKTPACSDLIPISSDEESSIPKSQVGPSSKLVASGSNTQDSHVILSEQDGNMSSSSNSSRSSSRRKKQTTFYGSPIRHSVNVIQSQSTTTPPSTPASPDKKVRFVVSGSDRSNQVGQSRADIPEDSAVLHRKFIRFPKKSTSDYPSRRSDK